MRPTTAKVAQHDAGHHANSAHKLILCKKMIGNRTPDPLVTKNNTLPLRQFIVSDFVKDFVAFVPWYTSSKHLAHIIRTLNAQSPDHTGPRRRNLIRSAEGARNGGDMTRTRALAHQECNYYHCTTSSIVLV
jgi:hypothetical protein